MWVNGPNAVCYGLNQCFALVEIGWCKPFCSICKTLLYNTLLLLTISPSAAYGSGKDSFRAPDIRTSNAFLLALPVNKDF